MCLRKSLIRPLGLDRNWIRYSQNDLYRAWQNYYIDYSKLKKELKRRTADGKAWNEDDEKAFKVLLASELDKIYEFQDAKV